MNSAQRTPGAQSLVEKRSSQICHSTDHGLFVLVVQIVTAVMMYLRILRVCISLTCIAYDLMT